MAGGRRKRQHFGRIHAFSCGRASFNGEHSLIGGPGFSRIVFCNDPECFEAGQLKYGGNYVRTTKYTLATYFPKALFEQFRRVANIYFLICAILSFTALSPYSAFSTVFPLVVVVGVTMGKEAVEDWRRKRQDIEMNNRKVKYHRGDGVFDYAKWMDLKVGDVVKVEKDEFFPADLILLSSSYDDAICYVETTNLDGETNLKLKQALDVTANLLDDSRFENFRAIIKCEDPNANLYSFLRNTDYIYGVVIFTGHDTKDLENGVMTRWYLRPDDTTIYYDPKRAPVAAILHFLTALMLYGYLIPISLYVSIEIVKVLQSVFINQDPHMYYEEGDKPARARTSNLNEELGQVDTILSDKTGTLTCNSMEFIKCSIAGTAYGRGITEVERAQARGKETPLAQENFLRLLAVCHTAIPEVDDETGKISYEAESPDEAAFVIGARELGFEFYERTQTSISLHELDPMSGRKVARTYKLMNIIEFSSARKRMSVIVRNEEGRLLLLSKGADSVMFERLAQDGREFEVQTRLHINEYADAGLRTLVLAYRELDDEEYNEFNEEFSQAKNLVSADREEIIEEVAERIEKDLILLGATAVEDKLQNGVPECIDKLAQAGIKLWVLTGDKMETAINIGFACSLLRQGMKQIIINSETPGIKALEKAGDKSAVDEAAKANVIQQISEGKALLNIASEDSEALALIIDGKSLIYALEDDVKDMFLELAIGCASVICCRSSPKQKALVTRLVKVKTGSTTLAIGDGANDVGMLQEADIGVGISGVEGMQAVMSSDIAIAQFRFLERLLLVHGHWCYRRISSMICYFFYKNIAFGFTLFFFEAYASFSGQAAYNDWYLSLYNVFFTSLPVIAMGVFDQDVAARFCLKFPLLYQEGVQNVLFSWTRILGWAFNGVLSSTLIFFFCACAMEHQAFRKGGEMALSINYFTLIQHVFIEACAPALSFWLVTLFVTVATLLPYFSYAAIQMRFFPMYHQMIQWIRNDGHSEDPEYCQMVRQRSLRSTTLHVDILNLDFKKFMFSFSFPLLSNQTGDLHC
ncbi:unnamed protein product, partial [Vitis vinifera]